jgi:hypothetical protein
MDRIHRIHRIHRIDRIDRVQRQRVHNIRQKLYQIAPAVFRESPVLFNFFQCFSDTVRLINKSCFRGGQMVSVDKIISKFN